MKKAFFITLFAIGIIISSYANNPDNSESSTHSQYLKGEVSKDNEILYQNFVNKYTAKEAKEKFKSLNLPIPEMNFELYYSTTTSYPTILSNDLYECTFDLVSRYNRFKQYHNKTNNTNDKLHEERFYEKEKEVRDRYRNLLSNKPEINYLVLLGVLKTNTGDSINNEKKIILINPQTADKEWLEITVDPFLQKRVALTLAANEGTAMTFLDSDGDSGLPSSITDDPLLSFILTLE